MVALGSRERNIGKLGDKMSIRVILILGVLAAVFATPLLAHTDDDQETGSVHFPVACNAAAAAHVELAVAQLHHMMYLNARGLFQEASELDPECAISLWGVAMTYIHPLWPDRPTPEVLAMGAELSARAVDIGGHDAREDAYIATVTAYFKEGETRDEAQRLQRFEKAWQLVFEHNVTDQEAKAFYVLAQLATVDRSDLSFAKQIKAGAMIEEVLSHDLGHPGAHHYIIHAYDFPGLADRALAVARNYGVIGPQVPHALHMMTHIFTRLGLWAESIEWNRRSADAAWEFSEQLGAVSSHYQHAMDYMAYAYLQTGEDEKALAIEDIMANLAPPFDAVNRDAQAYAFAAVPARCAVERKNWQAATRLEPRIPAKFPWESRHAPYVALTHFARGLGFAHQEQFEEAAAEVAILETIRSETEARSPYWAIQVEIQKLSVQAWISFLRGDTNVGLQLMRDAATLEAGTGKSPVTPGAVLPAAELLGEMLAASGQHKAAVAAYEVALRRSPRRLNSLYGAGRALESIGDSAAANDYYAQIAAMTNESSPRASIEYVLGL